VQSKKIEALIRSSGEAVEDLTGGVTTNVLTNRILSKERLWKELLEVLPHMEFCELSTDWDTG
jgi:hypothetical protein